MSDTDPTPNTPTTIGDRLAWFRGDVNQLLNLIRGTPGSDLATIAAAIIALRGVNNATLSSLLTEAQFDTQAQLQNSILLDIKTAAQHIKSGWNYGDGMTPYAILDSIYMLLVEMARTQQVSVGGLPPIAYSTDTENVDTITIDGRIYAKWLDPPANYITISTNHETLNSANWDGWYAYVQTTDPAPRMWTDTCLANQWFALSGSGNRNWSVAAKYPIRAYLRGPSTLQYVLVPSAVGQVRAVSIGTAAPAGVYANWYYPDLDDTSWPMAVGTDNVSLAGAKAVVAVPEQARYRHLYRQHFTLDTVATNAKISMVVEDKLEALYINGYYIGAGAGAGTGRNSYPQFVINPTYLISNAQNVIAVHILNDTGDPMGVAYKLEINYPV